MYSRREVLKILLGSGAALYLSPVYTGRASLAFADTKKKAGKFSISKSRLAEISPIDRSLAEVAPRIFFSDYPEEVHKVLWDKPGFVSGLGGKLPDPKERVPLVIIGGGMSGLLTAYKLRKHQPVILEQAPRFGGNAKGQSWKGIDYSIGAAYICKPDDDDDADKLLKEIGLRTSMRAKDGEDPVAIGSKIFEDFWKGESVQGDEKAKAQFLKVAKYFRAALAGEEIKYPDIPITDPEQEAYVKELDKLSFRAHVEAIAGEPLHPQIETAIEHYCWSSFGGSASEISAASGVNFYASEFGGLGVFPGGNSAITERLVERLSRELPPENFRAGSLVFDVKVVADGVIVSYRGADGQVASVHAKAVVMACPKFVVAKILSDIEPERVEAIRRLKYRSYLVANVLLKGGIANPFYDLYLLGDGTLHGSDAGTASRHQMVTDVVLGTWAKVNRNSTVLTLYRGMPYDSARAEMLAPDLYGRLRADFEKQIADSIVPLLKLKQENIVDLRIARWGHPLPLAGVGLIAEGVLEKVRAPFQERVFFIEQDNWALPAFETSLGEAVTWVPEVEKVLA